MYRFCIAVLLLNVGWVGPSATQTGNPPSGAAALVTQLQARCGPWISPPGEALQSLRYVFHLGNSTRQVEIVRGVSEVPRSFWQGTTLTMGLHWLLTQPERFDVELRPLTMAEAPGGPRTQLVARVKGDEPIFIVAGNGISDSWRGYFTHGAQEVLIELDDQQLPVREVSHGTEFRFTAWQEMQPGRWVPQQIDVRKGPTHYRMHFAWQGNAVWLLTHAESIQNDQATQLARVSDVAVNDQSVIDRLTAAHDSQEQGRNVLREMFAHNLHWLQPQPSFDSLEYTFHMPWPDVTEHCVIRREGPIVLEVSHDGYGKMAEQVGDRKILLPDGQYGSASREDRFAPVREMQRERNRPLYTEQLRRYALMGCQFDLPLFELPRVLDDTSVEVTDGEWEGTRSHVVTMTVPGSYLGCGTMLGFTSWSYVHHLSPAYEVLYIDQRRNVPIHETFISSRDNQRFEIDFLRYVEVEEGQWLPLRIVLRSEDYFTCRYDFQLIDGKHWLLKQAVSWFDPQDKSRAVVRDVKVNEPAALVDAALEQVQACRDLFEAEPTGGPNLDVDTFRFELGRMQSLGPISVLFTLDRAGELVLECTAAAEVAIDAGQTISVLLLDDKDRLLSAAQAEFVEREGQVVATASFGRSTALAGITRYVVSSSGGELQHTSREVRSIRVRPLRQEDAPPAQGPPVADASGNTRVIDVKCCSGEGDQVIAAVHFASQDRMNEFGLDVSVGVFDAQGGLIAAGAKRDRLLVKSHIVEDKWEIPLPVFSRADASHRVVVGVSRGQTYSAPMGSLWGRFMTNYPVFPIETMFAAEDPGCWLVGLEELERQIRDEVLQRGLLDSIRDWQEQVAERRTHHDRLSPHVERLLHILEQAQEPELIAAAIRLLGLSGDERAIEPVRGHLNDSDSGVQDVAAISLGLLGQGEGLARIEAVLGQPAPNFKENPDAYRRYRVRGDDALMALVMLRNDESIALARRLLLESLEQIEAVPHATGGYSMQGADVPDRLARLMGCLTDPRYVAVLTEALTRIDLQRPADGRYSPDEFLTSLQEYGPAARDYLVRRVESGDFSALPSRDPFYVPAVREALQREDISLWSIRSGIRYLWNTGTPEAIAALRELHEREMPDTDGRETVRMYLLEALAYHGDNRGLSEAFERLVALSEPGDSPAGERERRDWERKLDDDREAALDVFNRAATDAVFDLLEQHAATDNPDVRLAVLQVLEGERQISDSLRTAVESWGAGADDTPVAIQATKLLSRRR